MLIMLQLEPQTDFSFLHAVEIVFWRLSEGQQDPGSAPAILGPIPLDISCKRRSKSLPNLCRKKFSHVSCVVRCLLIVHQKWKELSVSITSLNSQFKLSLFGGW